MAEIMKKFLSFILTLIITFTLLCTYIGAENDVSFMLTDEEREYLASIKDEKLTLSYSSSLEYSLDEKGNEVGVLAPIISFLRDELLLDINAVKTDWSTGLNKMTVGETSFFAGVVFTEDRRKEYYLSDTYITSRVGIITRERYPVGSFSNLGTQVIGVYSSAVVLNYLKPFTNEYQQVITYNSTDELIHALLNEEIDVIVTSLPIQGEVLEHPEIKYELWLENHVVNQCMATSIEGLRGVISIFNRYLSTEQGSGLKSQIVSSKEQATFVGLREVYAEEIKALKTIFYDGITVASPRNMFLMSYEENGELKGVSAEILRYFTEITGIPVTVSDDENYYSQRLIIQDLMNGKLDAVCNYHLSANSDYDLIDTSSIIEDRLLFVSLKSRERLESYEDENIKLGILTFDREYFNINLPAKLTEIYYDNEADMMAALRSGELDAIVLSRLKLSYMLNYLDVTDIKASAAIQIIAPISYLFLKSNTELMTVMDASIDAVKSINPDKLFSVNNDLYLAKNLYNNTPVDDNTHDYIFVTVIIFLSLSFAILLYILFTKYLGFHRQINKLLDMQNAIDFATVDLKSRRYCSFGNFAVHKKYGFIVEGSYIYFNELERLYKINIDEQFALISKKMEEENTSLSYLEHEVEIDGRYIFFREFIHKISKNKFLCCVVDLTDERNLQNKFRDRLEIALEASMAGTWEIDVKTQTVDFDRRYAEIREIEKPSPITRAEYIDHLVKSSPHVGRKALSEYTSGGEIPSTLKIICKDGTARYVSNYTTILRDKDGVVERIIGLTMDETEMYTSEIKLLEALEAAKQASASKSDFLARMSHEIRTPMNAIIGMTDIGIKSEELHRKEYALGKIKTASATLLGIINQILDMSKIEAGKYELDCNVFDLYKMLGELEAIHKHNASVSLLNLEFMMDDDLPRMVYGDEISINQIVTNLLSNAMKFTKENGNVSLSVKKGRQEGSDIWLNFVVSDDGIGIPDGKYDKIFDVFEQGDGSSSRRYGGTGLGLAICKKLVELMDGSISVTSESGRGTIFTFDIKVQAAIIGNNKAMINEIKGIKEELIIPDLTGKNILIVEDVEINLEIAAAILSETNISVYSANNGIEALKMFSQEPDKYDIIFMDIQMPEMDGYETTSSIRAINTEKAKNIPIIAMTANVFKDEIEKCLSSGMDAHLGKPMEIDKIMEVLVKYLK